MAHFQNPASTVDIIVIKEIIKTEPEILLIKRKHPPFQNMWALPGGYLEYGGETLEQAACRELKEETNLIADKNYLKLLGVYSDPKRDPRGHIISHVYIAEKYEGIARAGDDAKELAFFPLQNLPELAFDHRQIIGDYIKLL